jgi:transposase InsO family protein
MKVMAFIDSGANVSSFSLDCIKRAGWTDRIEKPPDGEPTVIESFDQNKTIPRKGIIRSVIAADGKGLREHAFEVVNSKEELIIGTDLFEFIGIQMTGIPFRFPGDKKGHQAFKEAAEEEEALRRLRAPWGLEDRIEEGEFQWLAKELTEELTANLDIDPNVPACVNIPEATMTIPLNTEASFRHQYATPRAAQNAMDEKVADWAERNIIEPGDAASDFNSALLAVSKKDLAGQRTKWRICIDFRHINAAMTETFGHARERMPHLHQALAKTSGFSHASAIDLSESFHQLPIALNDRDKTTFTHRGKKWRCARWPFGLSPASLRFQKIMEVVLAGLENVTVVWIDDVLIYTKGTVQHHAEMVKEVLRRLTKHNLRVNPDKCNFGYKRVLMLGHYLSGDERSIDPLKAKTAADWPEPKTNKDVQRLLGFGNFVRDYVPCYARLTRPLEELKKLKRFALEEHPEAKEAFHKLRYALSHSPVLKEPRDDLPMLVATDASRYGVGAILYQEEKGKRRFIAFAAGSLKGAQKNYGATKRELLGIIFALKSFHNYIFRRKFTLFTDHKALTALYTVRKLSYVLEDWLDTLLQYDFDCVHRPGVDMILPDTLSRLFDEEQPATSGNRNTPRINVQTRRQRLAAAEQPQAQEQPEGHVDDAELDSHASESEEDAAQDEAALEAAPKHESPKNDGEADSQAVPKIQQRPATARHTLSRAFKIDELSKFPEKELASFIAERFMKTCPSIEDRAKLMADRHSPTHRGAETLWRELWRSGFFWPGMRRDALNMVSRCRPCIQYNIGREGFHPIRSLQAEAPWDHIAVDSLEMPASSSNTYKHILIVVDVKTRYLVTRPLKTHTMEEMAQVLHDVFTTFGPPKEMQSDNGTEYVNRLVKELCLQATIKHTTAAPFNPRANGLAETFVKAVKNALKKTLEGALDKWDQALPAVTFAINAHDGKRSKTAPFTLFWGRAANAWTDYALAEIMGPAIEQMEEALEALPDYDIVMADELQQERNDFKRIVADNVALGADKAQQAANAVIDQKRKSITRAYPKGAIVFICNEDRVSKFDPLWLGPFTVRKRNKKTGCYKLKDIEGEHLKRPMPISKLKWVSDHDVNLLDAEGQEIELAQERGVVDAIIKTKMEKGQHLYLVRWKHSQEQNEWLRAKDFDDPSSVISFWRKNAPTRKKRTKKDSLPAAESAVDADADVHDFTGQVLDIPADWFGRLYAKQTYKDDWKRATEHGVVQRRSSRKPRGEKTMWVVTQPRSETPLETHKMRQDAVEKYARRDKE